MSTLTLKRRIEEDLLKRPPKEVFSDFISSNDTFFQTVATTHPREILEERTAVYDVLLTDWFESVVKKANYKKPVSCIAHGGFGRCEMNPFSDVDVAFLVEDAITSESLQAVLSEETDYHGTVNPFKEKMGFDMHSGLHTLDNITDPKVFDAAQVTSICDARILFDQGDFANKFIKGVLKHRRIFSHLDHLVASWQKIILRDNAGIDNLNSFNIKEDMGGLRHLHLGLRTPNLSSPKSLSDLYPIIASQNPEVMDAYNFLLGIRGFVHLLKKEEFETSRGKKVELELTQRELKSLDVLDYRAYTAIGATFGHLAQKKLLESRRIIANYADMEIARVLKRGYTDKGFTYGSQGMFASDTVEQLQKSSDQEKRKKLFTLLSVAQTQSLPIDLVEVMERFKDAGNWMTPSEDFAKLFYAEGSLPTTLNLLNRLGAYNKCIPGAEELEVAIPPGGHKGQFLTSTAFGRQKVADFCTRMSETSAGVVEGRFNFQKIVEQFSLEDRSSNFPCIPNSKNSFSSKCHTRNVLFGSQRCI